MGAWWTQKEIKMLKNRYPDIEFLSRKLGRSKSAIFHKASYLGLTKSAPRCKSGRPRKVLLLSPVEPDPSAENEVDPKKSAALHKARIAEVSEKIRAVEDYLLSAPSNTDEWSQNMMNYHALIAKREQMIKNQ